MQKLRKDRNKNCKFSKQYKETLICIFLDLKEHKTSLEQIQIMTQINPHFFLTLKNILLASLIIVNKQSL